METPQTSISASERPVLLAVAASIEAQAICEGIGIRPQAVREWELCTLRPGLDMVVTGIGKANAAGAVARCATNHRIVLSIGIAGVLPPKAFQAGERMLGTRSIFADEGVETGVTFLTTADIGFPMPGVGENSLIPDFDLACKLKPFVDCEGVIATVSTCSGTDERARQVVSRTKAICEAMEGAAVGLAAARLGLAFAEVRVISNTTGERGKQRWDIHAAMASLRKLANDLAGVLARA